MHMHTRAHTHTHRNARAHTRTETHARAHTHAQKHTRTHTHPQAPTAPAVFFSKPEKRKQCETQHSIKPTGLRSTLRTALGTKKELHFNWDQSLQVKESVCWFILGNQSSWGPPAGNGKFPDPSTPTRIWPSEAHSACLRDSQGLHSHRPLLLLPNLGGSRFNSLTQF